MLTTKLQHEGQLGLDGVTNTSNYEMKNPRSACTRIIDNLGPKTQTVCNFIFIRPQFKLSECYTDSLKAETVRMLHRLFKAETVS